MPTVKKQLLNQIKKQLEKDPEYDGSSLELKMKTIQDEFNEFIVKFINDEDNDAAIELDGIDAFIKATKEK